MLTSVHRRPPPSVIWADYDRWVSADTREPRRMRPYLSPVGPAGRCRSVDLILRLARSRYSYPHERASRPDGTGRRGTGHHHRGLADPPSPREPSSQSHGVTGGKHGPRAPSALPIICWSALNIAELPMTFQIDRFGAALAPNERIMSPAARRRQQDFLTCLHSGQRASPSSVVPCRWRYSAQPGPQAPGWRRSQPGRGEVFFSGRAARMLLRGRGASPVGAIFHVRRVGDLGQVGSVGVRRVDVFLAVDVHAEHDPLPAG